MNKKTNIKIKVESPLFIEKSGLNNIQIMHNMFSLGWAQSKKYLRKNKLLNTKGEEFLYPNLVKTAFTYGTVLRNTFKCGF